jgi:hypothetical protein
VRPIVHREEDVHLINAVSEHLGMGSFTCETRSTDDGRWQSMYIQDEVDYFAGPVESTRTEALEAAQWYFVAFFKDYKDSLEGEGLEGEGGAAEHS